MKKYLIKQLTEITAWIGFIVILMAIFSPREYIAIAGLLLIATDDEAVKNWIARNAPWLSNKIDKL